MLGLQLEIESVSRAHPGREPRDIYSAVDLKGDLPGRVVLALDRARATVIVCEMLMAEPDEIEEDLIDGIGEMVNVLVGNDEIPVQGVVQWTRSWQDSAQIPAAGVRLTPSRVGLAALDKLGLEVFAKQVSLDSLANRRSSVGFSEKW
jgi:hypothetical protein